MTFDVEPTLKDFTESYLIVTRRKRWQGMLFLILTAIGLGGVAYLYPGALMSMGVLSACCLFLALLQPWFVRSTIRQLWSQNPYFSESNHVTLEPEGFTCQAYSGYQFARWHVFSHWSETPRLLLIFRGHEWFQCIPKRCIGDAAAVNECREMLKSMIGRTQYVKPIPAFPVASKAQPAADE